MSCVVVQLRRIYPSFAEDEIIFNYILAHKTLQLQTEGVLFPHMTQDYIVINPHRNTRALKKSNQSKLATTLCVPNYLSE